MQNNDPKAETTEFKGRRSTLEPLSKRQAWAKLHNRFAVKAAAFNIPY